MKNILVFGGFGFLGYYLSKELNQRGYNVTVADIQKDKELENMVAFVECDITNRLNIQNVFKKNPLIMYIIWQVMLIWKQQTNSQLKQFIQM